MKKRYLIHQVYRESERQSDIQFIIISLLGNRVTKAKMFLLDEHNVSEEMATLKRTLSGDPEPTQQYGLAGYDLWTKLNVLQEIGSVKRAF